MGDWHQRAVIVFNGEIYNFPELRDPLERKGYRFRTRRKPRCCSMPTWMRSCLSNSVEGMFAFAIWDRERRTLFAARDRMGEKPFYYTLQQGVFAFASELSPSPGCPC